MEWNVESDEMKLPFFDSRNAITIPEKSWGKFRDIMDDYVEKMKEATAEVENQSTDEKKEESEK